MVRDTPMTQVDKGNLSIKPVDMIDDGGDAPGLFPKAYHSHLTYFYCLKQYAERIGFEMGRRDDRWNGSWHAVHVKRDAEILEIQKVEKFVEKIFNLNIEVKKLV